MSSLSDHRRKLVAHVSDPLYRTGYLLTIGAAITSVLGLAFWVLAARLYSAHVVGINSALLSAVLFIAGISALGTYNTLVQYLPAAGPRTGVVIIRCYAAIVAAALVCGVIAAATSPLWSPHALAFVGRDPAWFVGFVLASVFSVVFGIQDGVMTGLKQPQWVPVENALFSAIKLVLLIVLAATMPTSGPFVAWNLPGALLVLVISWLIFGRLVPIHRRRPAAFTFDVRRFVTISAANQAGSIFIFGMTLLMPVIVAAATNATTTAYFYVPWTLGTGILRLAVIGTVAMTSEATPDRERLGDLTRRTLLQTFRLLLPLVVGEVVLARFALRLYGSAYAAHGVTLLRLVALGSIPNVVYTVGEALLRIEHRPRQLIVTQAGQSILFVALSVVLLQSDGIDGVGIAYVVSQVGFAAWLFATTLRPHLVRKPAARSG